SSDGRKLQALAATLLGLDAAVESVTISSPSTAASAADPG
ncbi:glutamate racemase, partial [Burkholderia pseudomallei]